MKLKVLPIKLTVALLGLLSLTRTELNGGRQIGRVHDRDVTVRRKSQRDFLDDIKSKFFLDLYSAHMSPHEQEFGHVRESPDSWEQRFEKIDRAKQRYQGKIKWGDKDDGYGEHYYDYNHHGHDDDHLHEKHGSKYKIKEPVTPDPFDLVELRHLEDNGDVEFINDKAKYEITHSLHNKCSHHGGNYKAA